MSMFYDSPIDYCPVANRFVLLDQTREACARDMNCGARDCPLEYYFARRDLKEYNRRRNFRRGRRST